jgi:hypothetical protein
MNEQTENITRVNQAISRYVAAFLDAHLNQEFHVDDLRQYVSANVEGYVAPASPDRILRDLRQRNKVNYVVVSRSKSLYKALPVF